MLVYKCPKCGTTYNRRDVPQNEMCSLCDMYLKVVNIKEDNSQENVQKATSVSRVGRQSSVGRVRTTSVVTIEEKSENVIHDFSSSKEDERNVDYTYTNTVIGTVSTNVIEGTIISATNDIGFRRLPWEKIFDRYFYSQNVSNNQNSIYVRCVDESGNVTNKTIVMYGQIKGGVGIFRTGMKIRGEGKFNRQNEFVAKSLLIEDGISVSTRTELADVIYFFSPLLVLLLGVFVFNFINVLKEIINSQYIKWYFLSLIGTFFVSYYAIGKVVRIPIVNKIRACTWVSIIFGTILFFTCKAIFVA